MMGLGWLRASPIRCRRRSAPTAMYDACLGFWLLYGANSQRSFRTLSPIESRPCPPNNQWLPDVSVQELALNRAPGMLPLEATPSVPYMPGAPPTKSPPIQVQAPAAGLNFHKSLRWLYASIDSKPCPPNNQRFPVGSIQEVVYCLAPGTLVVAAVP